MTVDPERVSTLAAAYTAAWNSGSPEAVASFYAPDGHIYMMPYWEECYHCEMAMKCISSR